MKNLSFIENNVRMIRTILCVLAGIVLFFVLHANFTFGFVPLFIFLLLFLLFTIIVRPSQPIAYSVMVILFGGLSMYALNNYINPQRAVFANNDHHALRLDGIRIDDPIKKSFILAGDTDKAFFDDKSFNGTLSIADITDSSVILRSKGFTRPVYKKVYGKGGYSDNQTELVANEGVHPLFQDEVILVSNTKNENGSRRKVSLQIKECDSGKRGVSDSSFYIFAQGTSSRHTFLRRSLPLTDIAADVILDFDPSGISIIRDATDMGCSKAELIGKDGAYVGKKYSFDIDSRADLSEIIIDGRSYKPHMLNTNIEIPLNVPFYIGSGSSKTESVVFRKRHDGDTLCLEYELPRYRYLSSFENQVENTLMITTTLFDTTSPDNLELSPAYTDNILLFDLFDKQNNRNQLSPSYISFISGESSKLLDYDFITSDGRKSKQRSLDYICSQKDIKFSNLDNPSDSLAFYSKAGLMHTVSTIANPGVSWMMSVENFKETTPFSSRNISLLLFAVIMICASMFLYKLDSSQHYSLMEFVAYLILIAFLTIRLFLMWRTTVFPPVNAISHYEFQHFRTAVPMGWLIASFVVFVVSILLVKILIGRRPIRKTPDFPWLRKLLTPEWKLYVVIPVVYAVGFLSSYILPAERICNIMIPVAIAVMFEILIHWLHGTTYIQDIKMKDSKDPVGARRNPILMSMLNLAIASGITFYKDGGYGVMFLVFSLLFLIYKFFDLRIYTHQNKNSRKATVCKYLLLLFAVAIFTLYKYLFIFLFNHIIAFFIVAFVLILILAALIIVVLDVPLKGKIRKWLIPTIIVVVAASSCAVLYHVLGDKMYGKHMEYRIRVHMDSPENTLAYHIKSQSAQNKFMQASINGWIMDEYKEIGKEVRVFGEDGAGYFKMQPQSKLGALWFAQTTDIVVSRFIIAEHSQLLAILFIAAFVVMLAIALQVRSVHRWSKMIMVMVPLLFATQAMLIWLANTGRFIFFGQDFPLISVTSKLSIIYFFFMLLVMVIASLIERKPLPKKVSASDWDTMDYNNLSLSVQIILIFILAMVVFLLKESLFLYEAFIAYLAVVLVRQFLHKRSGKKTDKNKEHEKDNIVSNIFHLLIHVIIFAVLAFGFYKINGINKAPEKMHGTYHVGELLSGKSGANADIEIINHHLKDYQKSHRMKLQTDMYNQMNGFKEYIDTLDIPCLAGNSDSSSFTRLILDDFFRNGSRRNSVSNLLHVRNQRSYDSRGAARDTLVLALKADYFTLVLPKRITTGWKGSIIEHYDAPFVQDVRSVRKYRDSLILSSSCVYGDKDVLLVTAGSGKKVRVIGADALVDINTRNLPVSRVNNTDVLIENGRKVTTSLDKVNYFARNVMINGQRTFLYPRGSELFWMRDFASQILTAKNSVPKNKRNKKNYHDNVAVTLDGELVTSIYSTYMSNSDLQGGDRTVVVADGDGHIKAMVDFRKREEFRLNPNDSKTIAEVREELMLNGEMGKTRDRMYFETMAMSPLRLGPGSSQKPLTWTAVSTSFNTGWWENLAVATIDNDKLYTAENAKSFSKKDREKLKNGRYLFRHFAGHRIQSSFSSIKSDEGEGDLPITLDYFIRRSSNFYNAVLAYLGSFPVEGYYGNDAWLSVSKEYDQKTLFRVKPKYKDAFQYDSLFPIMTIDKKNPKEVVFNEFLHKDLAMDTTALLPLGLYRNLGLRSKTFVKDENGEYQKDKKGHFITTSVRPTSLYPSIRRYKRNADDKLVTVATVVPAASYYNLTSRLNRDRKPELNENMVRAVAIGNNTAWQVSPLKMAEMYGRMMTMNNAYTLSLEPGNVRRYEPFEIDESWYSKNDYHKVRTGLLTGMSQNFQKGSSKALTGQASGVRPDLVGLDVVENANGENYYIYGKTGTIDGKYSGISMEDHLLAVVITDRKLTECSFDDLENVRFYVVYFADYGELRESNGGVTGLKPVWQKIDKEILNAVIGSRDFQNYMNTAKNSSND